MISYSPCLCRIVSNPFFGKNRLTFEGTDFPAKKEGIRYHNAVAAFILEFFFGKKIVNVKDIDGKVYHLNRGSLSDWLIANHEGFKNNTQKNMLTVTEASIRIYLDEILKKKSPENIVKICDIKNDLDLKEKNKVLADRRGSKIDEKKLSEEIAELRKKLEELQKKNKKA